MPNQAQDNLPLFATQGGGIAVFQDSTFVWYELPDWMEALPAGDPDKQKIGDTIHPEWDVQPINDIARDTMLDDEYSDDYSDFLDPAGF